MCFDNLKCTGKVFMVELLSFLLLKQLSTPVRTYPLI